MALPLVFKLTDAGIAAAFNAESTGIELELTHVAFGAGFKTPDGLEVALVNERKRVPISAGARVLPDQVRLTALWASDTDESAIKEIGVFAGNILFAYASRSGLSIGFKSAGVDFVFYYDWALKDIPANTVTIQVDENAPVAMAALAAHEADPLAHSQYLRRSAVAQDSDAFKWGGVAGGTSDSILLTLPAESYLTSYRAGQTFRFLAQYGNSGPISIAINGLSARSARKNGTTALVSGDIVAGHVYDVTYDGANFQLAGGTVASGDGGIPEGDIFEVYPFIASAGQTSFAAPYDPGSLLLFVKGDVVPPARFTATDGANVVAHAPCAAGDEVVIVTFLATAAANVYTKPQTYSRAEVVALLTSKQDALGFVPVQQGGGIDQLTNKIRLGWNGTDGLLAQVDTTPLGKLWTSANFNPALKADVTTVTTLSASASLVASNAGLVLIDASAAATTISLPSASAGLGIIDFIVRRVDNTGNRLVVQASGTDKVKFHTHLRAAGYAFFTLMGAGDWWHLRSDGAGNWWPVGRYDNTALGRPVFETTTTFSPGGYGALNGSIFNRAEWPWLWDHAQQSGMVILDSARSGKEGNWTSGDGSVTFRGPEGRGEFLRILDESRGADALRSAGSAQSGTQIPLMTVARSGGSSGLLVTPAITSILADGQAVLPTGSEAVVSGGASAYLSVPLTSTGSISNVSYATRPRNIAYPGRIKLI